MNTNFKNNIYKRIVLGGLMLVFCMGLLMPSLVQAADCDMHGTEPQCPSGSPIRLQVGIPGFTSSCTYMKKTYPNGELSEVETKLYCVKGLPEYINSFYKFFISIVGILAVIMIMVGGFQWLMAAGNAQKISGAKTIIISAIMGLVLALTSYTILNVLNPDVLNLKLDPPKVELETPEGAEFCVDTKTPIVQQYGDDEPMCGTTYVYKDKNDKGEDEFCVGTKCSGFKNIGKICANYAGTYTCMHSITIGNNVWRYNASYNCGELVFIQRLVEGEEYFVGTGCSSGDCVLWLDKGATLPSDMSKLNGSGYTDIRKGKLNQAKCEPQP